MPARLSTFIPTTRAVSTTIVISQFQVAGGTAADEFIELHNVSASDFQLNGHRVVYRSAAGTSDVAVVNWATSTVIPAGGYYLITHATGYDGAPPAGDITFPGGSTGTFAAAGGGFAIRNGAANTGTIIDSVGYGTATNAFVETTVEAAPAANTSAARLNNGCTDTDNNANDFVNLNPSAPRNSGTTPITCGGGPAQPSLSINNVTLDEGNAGTTAFTFTVSLSSSTHGGVTFNIATADGTAQDDNPVAEDNDYQANSATGVSIPNGSQTAQFTVNVNGDTATEPDENFTVNVTGVTGATLADGVGVGTIVNDDGIVITPIHVIQGSTGGGDAPSPVAGQSRTTTGIVTLLRTGSNAAGGTANSFFIQTPNDDGDPNTSEGLLVFTGGVPTYTTTGTPVAVGDEVRVTGTVTEFFNMTELSPTTNITVIDTGNPLPTAVTLTTTILDPTAPPAQPQLEKYEGMRMSAASLRTVAPNDNFYEVETVLGSVPRPLREPGIEISTPAVPPDPGEAAPDCCIPRWDENPERLKVDTNGRAGAPLNPYTSNVTFTNISGPLDFSFSEYKLIPDATPTASANMSAVAVPVPSASEFTVAGFNIENFNNNATQRQKAALAIRDVMRLPHIIGVAEIFDLADLQALAAEVNTIAPGSSYAAYLVESDGSTTNDNDQDVGYLVDTSRVTVNSVTQEEQTGCNGTPATCNTYTDPNNGQPALLNDRPPLVLNANVQPLGANQPVIVVVNHMRSFICIDADVDPAVAANCDGGASDGPRVRAKRKAQGEFLADLLQDLQAANPTTPVISVGDYNAYQFSDGYTDPIATIKGNPTPDNQLAVDQSPDLVNPNFINLIDGLPLSEQYSFIFEGTPQVLDHVLVNTVANSRKTRFHIARNNADFPENPAAAFASNAARPERNSDHDMPVAYFSLAAQQAQGSVIISEFRFRGPNGSDDEFVELYNNTDSAVTVSTADGSEGWALVASDGATRFIVPNGAVIPARGHFLAVNQNAYSLSLYPSGNNGTSATTANGDEVLLPGLGTALGYIVDIPDNGGIALFRTANTASFDLGNRLDAAGYTSAPSLYREGTGFPAGGAETTSNLEYSFFRDFRPTGFPRDTGDNAPDFLSADVAATPGLGLGQRLGAPGPENRTSPVERSAGFPTTLLNPSVGSAQAPNRVRLTCAQGAEECNSTRSRLGTLSIRRTLTNNTGAPVTKLRFRVVDITALPRPNGTTADVRALSSSNIQVTINGSPVDVRGTTLEQPPTQALGGGMNSSLDVGFINLGAPLAVGASVNVQFLLGVQETGGYKFYVNIEALP